jgi:hypothetical protein
MFSAAFLQEENTNYINTRMVAQTRFGGRKG